MYNELKELLRICSEDISIELFRKDYLKWDEEMKSHARNIAINKEIFKEFDSTKAESTPKAFPTREGNYICYTNKEGRTVFISIKKDI